MKIFKIILVWLRIFAKSIHGIFCMNIGDKVIYRNEKYTLAQGVCDPYWDLIDDKNDRIHIHRKNFKKLWTMKNILHSFLVSYWFYMGYWFDIMVMNFPKGAWDRRSLKLGF